MAAVIAGERHVDGHDRQFVLLEGVGHAVLGVAEGSGEVSGAAHGDVDGEVVFAVAAACAGDRRVLLGGGFGEALDRTRLDRDLAAPVAGELEVVAGEVWPGDLLEREVAEQQEREDARPGDDRTGRAAVDVVRGQSRQVRYPRCGSR